MLDEEKLDLLSKITYMTVGYVVSADRYRKVMKDKLFKLKKADFNKNLFEFMYDDGENYCISVTYDEETNELDFIDWYTTEPLVRDFFIKDLDLVFADNLIIDVLNTKSVKFLFSGDFTKKSVLLSFRDLIADNNLEITTQDILEFYLSESFVTNSYVLDSLKKFDKESYDVICNFSRNYFIPDFEFSASTFKEDGIYIRKSNRNSVPRFDLVIPMSNLCDFYKRFSENKITSIEVDRIMPGLFDKFEEIQFGCTFFGLNEHAQISKLLGEVTEYHSDLLTKDREYMDDFAKFHFDNIKEKFILDLIDNIDSSSSIISRNLNITKTIIENYVTNFSDF